MELKNHLKVLIGGFLYFIFLILVIHLNTSSNQNNHHNLVGK